MCPGDWGTSGMSAQNIETIMDVEGNMLQTLIL
jgi:hypothetical protein